MNGNFFPAKDYDKPYDEMHGNYDEGRANYDEGRADYDEWNANDSFRVYADDGTYI